MFGWLKKLKPQPEERKLPDEPILRELQELIDWLIATLHSSNRKTREKSLYNYVPINQYTSMYPISAIPEELRRFLLWLATIKLETSTEGLDLEEKYRHGKLLEGGEFLAKFVENEAIFNEYFYIDNNRIFYRDTIEYAEQIRISHYVRRNYFEMVIIY